MSAPPASSAPPAAPPAAPTGPTTGGKRSAWMAHVKATMRAHKGKPLSAVLKMAKKTYKKKGGASITPAAVGGRRSRRGTRRSRKH